MKIIKFSCKSSTFIKMQQKSSKFYESPSKIIELLSKFMNNHQNFMKNIALHERILQHLFLIFSSILWPAKWLPAAWSYLPLVLTFPGYELGRTCWVRCSTKHINFRSNLVWTGNRQICKHSQIFVVKTKSTWPNCLNWIEKRPICIDS